MKRILVILALTLIAREARGQFAPQVWTADQDGGDFLCYDVHSLQVNNMSGVGSRCVEVDSTGTFFAVACSSIGGVSSVTGTAGRIVATPTTGAVVIDLATFGSSPSCTNASVVVDAYGRSTCTSGTAPVTSIGVTGPITTTGGTTPTIGISLPAGQIGFGTGTNVTSASWLQADASTQRLLLSSSVGVGPFPGAFITNSSAGVGAFAQFCLVNDQGTSKDACAYLGSSTYSGADSCPNCLTFDTGAGASAYINFSPNNVKTMIVQPNVVEFPTSNGGAISQEFDQAAAQSIDKINGSFFIGTNDSHFLGLYANGVTRVFIEPGGEVQTIAIAAPSTPTSGRGSIYVDSTAKTLSVKDDAGNVSHTARTQTAAAGKAFTALSDAGVFTETSFQAPLTACTDYVSVPCQTGSTDIGGTNGTTTVIGIESDAAMRGDVLATEVATPGAPAAGKVRIYASTAGNVSAIDPSGNINHGIRTQSCGASQYVTGVNVSGVEGCSQPAFTDVTGTLACGQSEGPFMGDTTKASGSCATVTSALTDAAGAGSSHATTGSWGANLLLQTDAGGAIKAAGAACSVLPALAGSDGIASAGGTCTVTNAYKGKVLASSTASTPDYLINKVSSSDGSINVTLGGAGTLLDLGVRQTKHDYFVNNQSLQAQDTTLRYMATSSFLPDYTGAGAIQYPNDFLAGHVAYKLNIVESTGTASSMDCWVYRNGSQLAATNVNFTPGITTGLLTVASAATGSASANDVYGFACLYNGNFVTGPFGATIAFTVQMVLTP
jgi:hypothetical protein